MLLADLLPSPPGAIARVLGIAPDRTGGLTAKGYNRASNSVFFASNSSWVM